MLLRELVLPAFFLLHCESYYTRRADQKSETCTANLMRTVQTASQDVPVHSDRIVGNPDIGHKRPSGKLQAKHVSQGWIARSRHLDNALILAPMGRPPARPFGDVLVYSGCFVCAGAVSGFSRAAISRLRAATAGSSVSPRTHALLQRGQLQKN